MPVARFAIDPNARTTPDHPDGRILTNAAAGTLYATNPTGAWIWQRLAEGLDTQHIVSRLAAEWDVPLERSEQDVASFLRALEERSLIRPVVPGS